MKLIHDPYDIPVRPAIISFSGGRSSGYMLYHILEACGGLPDDVKVVFANTGKEREETFEFVQRCSQEWGVHITWLERAIGKKSTYEIVSHNSAHRKGEPFESFLDTQVRLPSPSSQGGGTGRTCTADLKIKPINQWAKKELGINKWSSVIGFRPDEMHRVARLYQCGKPEDTQTIFKFSDEEKKKRKRKRKPRLYETGLKAQTPMAFDIKATEQGVKDFWKKMPFDLGIESWEGNCDMCFLKKRDVIKALMRKYPGMADWWIKQEKMQRADKFPDSNKFRIDRPDYEHLQQEVIDNPHMVLTHDELDLLQTGIECGCHD